MAVKVREYFHKGDEKGKRPSDKYWRHIDAETVNLGEPTRLECQCGYRTYGPKWDETGHQGKHDRWEWCLEAERESMEYLENIQVTPLPNEGARYDCPCSYSALDVDWNDLEHRERHDRWELAEKEKLAFNDLDDWPKELISGQPPKEQTKPEWNHYECLPIRDVNPQAKLIWIDAKETADAKAEWCKRMKINIWSEEMHRRDMLRLNGEWLAGLRTEAVIDRMRKGCWG